MKDKNPKNILDRKTLNRRTMLRTTAVGARGLVAGNGITQSNK